MGKGLRGWSLDDRDPATIRRLMPIWAWFYEYYFRVEARGWEHVPHEPVLFVGSHNGGLAAPDMYMMMYDWFVRFGIESRPVYGLMHPKVTQVVPLLADVAIKLGAVVAHPKMAAAALDSGANVLVYPGGAKDVFRNYRDRDRIHLDNNQAFIKLALRRNVPIVPAISWGAHDTLIVLADLYPWIAKLHGLGMPWFLGIDPEIFPVYLGLPWGLGIGPIVNFPLPVRIHTRVLEPIRFEWYGAEAARDRGYVAECFQMVEGAMQRGLDRLVLESGGKSD
jgi:1-acyl-sn-glycerol-3-phosphate acyltransferase